MKTKQQRKLAVLRDALKQIRAKKYKPSCGDVFEVDWESSLSKKLFESEEDNSTKEVRAILKEELPKKGNNCQVCARGSLLVSRIRLENRFKVEDLQLVNGNSFDRDSVEDKYLMALFSERELAMMENAFETSNYRYSEQDAINKEILSKEDNSKSFKFGRKYKNATNRLIKILENAIKHKGTFTP